MKKIIFFLLSLVLTFGCVSGVYLKKTDLPDGITYYSKDKQFIVHPDWYWRIRPTSLFYEGYNQYLGEYNKNTIGYNYLTQRNPLYKEENVKVIGEMMQNNEKFYIAHWEQSGFFFIKENDYLFDKKYKKYIIPIEEDSTQEQKIEVIRYYRNKKFIVFSSFGITTTLDDDPIYSIGFISKDEIKQGTTKQVRNYYNYLNKFVIILINNDFVLSFFKDITIRPDFMFYPSIYWKNTQYQIDNGAIYNGEIFVAKYIIINWGNAVYALPCD